MTHAVISGVLDQLSSILQTEVNLRKESEQLKGTLTLIRGVLKDAEEKQVKNENGAVKAWLEQLTRISYDADDVLDDWKTEILSSQIQLLDDDDAHVSEKLWSCLFSLFSCFKRAEVRNDFGNKMIDINERLDRIVKDIPVLNLTEKQSREEPGPGTSSLVDTSEIYGRVDDIYSIIGMLLSETSHQDSHVPLISIVGTGGFGKTTLVQLIFKDVLVTSNFEKLMWVCVSKPFDLQRVAKSIVKEATGDVPNIVVWQDLHRSLSESVRGKKFLLVLDDVWTYDPEIWRKLRVSLDAGEQGSRIIITTRDENIARKMVSTYIHRLEQLSDEECWSLFKHIAFRERQDKREKFEEIGKQIACKCKGVPLAVKIMASLLRLEGSVREWEGVLESDMWEVLSEDEHDFLPSLSLSYYALPSHLKRCFSYCGIFHEDVEIDKDGLVKLWMAQGFLNYDSSKDLEKIGTGYFNDLAMRSLFQDFKKDSEGNVIGCKMHDLVLDFARHLVKSESSIFMKNDREVGNIKLRHFDAANHVNDAANDVEDTSVWLKSIICKMTYLRVLDFKDISLEKLPHEVDRLLHLRLLNLSDNTKMEELPETVCNLFNLQTLELNECQSLRKLPEGIGKLRNLRHLELEGTDQLSYFPQGLERLSCLRTLSRVRLDRDGGKGCQIAGLKLLDHIQGELRIEGLGQVADSKQAELKKKEKLQSLVLSFYEEEQDAAREEERKRIESVLDGLQPHTNLAKLAIEGYEGNKFPSWMSTNTALPNLVKLELSFCNQSLELPALGRLQNLEVLILSELGSAKRIGCEFYGLGSTGGEDSVQSAPPVAVFPVLKKLTLFGMPEWEEQGDEIKLPIRRDEGEEGFIMPCLQVLEINSCPKLKVVPHYLFSPALRSLEISNCPQLTGRQPCLPHLLEKLELNGNTGFLSKSILPLLISGIGSPDHNNTTNNENDYPNLHTFSIWPSRQSSLPQGLNKLTAIQTLEFQYCEFLDFTPEDLKHLPMLQRLEIRNCPILEERCRKRESWTTNSHIPEIILNGDDFIPE